MTENQALESALSHFRQEKGRLLVGHTPISDIAGEHGTPLYIYSSNVIRRRQETLRKSLPQNVQIYYAAKANPHVGIIRMMGELYDGLDISSRGEMVKALEAGISPTVMSFAGPGKRESELDFSLSRDIGSISIESEQELLQVRSLCRKRGVPAHVMVRVNPGFELTQSGMAMGGPRQFGVDSEQVPAVLECIRGDGHIDFQGIHIYSGSQNLNALAIVEHFEKIIGYALDVSALMNMPLKAINVGGGFGIPYFSHEKDLDLTAIGAGLGDILKRHADRLGSTVIRLELGRYLVGECGIYVCRVLYRKVSRGRVFLILDGGMHHHLAASGNLGQSLARRPMPLTVTDGLERPFEKVTVVGPLCTPLDSFGTVEMPHAEAGDLIAVMNSGAYGLSASPVGFLSHDPPEEIIV